MFDVIPIPAFKDNYIWLLRKGAAAVVVDPGDAQPVLDRLERDRLSLNAILITHHHADHQGGVATLLAHSPVEVYGPVAESITGITKSLRDGDSIRIASCDIEFQVIAVPGHTLGHIAYYGSGCLFCGDTLFGGGCGRLFEGTAEQMALSLKRLASLPDATEVYCAHEYTQANLRFAQVVEPGNALLSQRVEDVAVARAKGISTMPSTIGLENATNPFLRCNVPEVITSARLRAPAAQDSVAVFATLRRWKDGF